MVVTPAGTSPAITTLADKGLVFRTVPSDEYQGQVLARTMLARGTKKIAVAYVNNDYGKGFAEAFRKEFEAKGGTIAGFAGHEENRASYRSDLAALAARVRIRCCSSILAIPRVSPCCASPLRTTSSKPMLGARA